MRIWDIEGLIKDLRNKTLSPREEMLYLMFTIILYAFSAGSSNTETYWGSMSILFIVTITAFGILWCYQANQNGDREDFIKRYISLSWLITIRMFLLTVILSLGFMAVVKNVPAIPDTPENVEIFTFCISVLVEIIYYIWLRNCFQKVSSPDMSVSE